MNYKCKKCKRYVREEEQKPLMRKHKLCVMCVMRYEMIANQSTYRGY